MPLKRHTRLSEWLHFHKFSATDLADKVGVTRQTISKIARGDFENVNVSVIQALCDHTTLSWEDLCTEGPSSTHRRTGIHLVDEIIPNLLRDLHEETTARRYHKYISKDFKCTSPHFYMPGPARIGSLWAVAPGQTVNGEKLDYSKGYVDWVTMCRYNRPNLDDLGTGEFPDRFVSVESIDIVGTPDERDTSKEILIITKSIWHVSHQLHRKPMTLLSIKTEDPISGATSEIPFRIKSWWWLEIPTP